MKDLEFPDGPWLEAMLDGALAEDIGPGDATTAIAVPPNLRATARIVARQAGVAAGLPLLKRLFERLDSGVAVAVNVQDGGRFEPGQTMAEIDGAVAAVLTGERTALNFLQHLSGIATLTAHYVDAVRGTNCQVLDTRKTLPGWRALAKYAVRCGGGRNHRFGLYDRILLKDNHWAASGERIEDLVVRGRRVFPGLAIEVEVDSMEQFERVLPLNVDWILLDNFAPEQARTAVCARDQQGSGTRLEASGNVTLETVTAFARAGVDACSIGRLTHSAPALDLALELVLGDDPVQDREARP